MGLDHAKRDRLAGWMRTEQRTFSDIDRIWADWWQLPAARRDGLRRMLDQLTGSSDL